MGLTKKLFYQTLPLILLAVLFLSNRVDSAEAVVDLSPIYKSGSLRGRVPSGGLAANSEIELTAVFNGDPNICAGSLNYRLYRTMAHAIGGNLNQIEYLAKGSGDGLVFSYNFNSGPANQKNVYWAIFYCWSSDSPETALRTARLWQSFRFDQTTVLASPSSSPTPRATGGGFIEFPSPSTNKNLMDFVKTILIWIRNLAIPVAFLAIIYGGSLMLLSQGNKKMIDTGKKVLTYAIIGLAVILIGGGFRTLIQSILNLAK
jgi:hypothetical protein